MLITFEKEYLKELYELGKTSDKQHRFQPEIVKKYKRCIDLMLDVLDTCELLKYNSLNFEKLVGDKQGLFSIRVNNQYRIEFTAKEEQRKPMTVVICNIIELSNHYK